MASSDTSPPLPSIFMIHRSPTQGPTSLSGPTGSSTSIGLYDPVLSLTYGIALQGIFPSPNRRRNLASFDSMLAFIELFAFSFVPKYFASCGGQLLPVNQNQGLYSLLGTTYGGDGQVNFKLPGR